MSGGPQPRWLAVLGIGEDGIDGISPTARALISGAALVVGGARHLALAAPLLRGETLAWPHPMSDAYPAILARRGLNVAVLASGDPFCFGVGAALARLVGPGEMLCIPAPSAFSLACARLGWALQEIATASACGRPLAALAPLLQPGARVLVLSGDEDGPRLLAEFLRARGFGPTVMHVLEALGGPRERIRAATAEGFALDGIARPNLVALEVAAGQGARVIPLATGLPDDFFAHDGQITKREIRAVTLSALAPRRGEVLWDVGCGSGSVGIEWMLRDPSCAAIGIEADPARAARAASNALALGVPGLRVVTGAAPAAFAGLPTPDAVFIGGGATDDGVLDTCWAALRAGGRIVVNAVTIETESVLFAARARLGGTLTRLGVERLDAIGTMHGFRPAMRVTQWAAVKP